MLGTRGLRLGVLRPAIYRAQVRAILGAARELREAGRDPRPEIMLPLVTVPGSSRGGSG
jgi:pyruvate, orthophosphate dikinase